MASLVTDILSSAGKLEREELGDKISAFCKHISDVKLQVHQSLQSRYEDFLPVAIYTDELEMRVSSCYEEFQSLDDLIQKKLLSNVQESASEFDDVSQQLTVAKMTLQVLRTVVAFHEALEGCNREFKNRNFIGSVRCLLQCHILLLDLKNSWEGQIRSLEALNCEYTVQSEKLIYDLRVIWNGHLKWTEEKPEGETEGIIRDHSVSLKVGTDHAALESAIQAMNLLDYLNVPLKEFGKALSVRFFHPIVMDPTVTVTTSREGDANILHMKIGTPPAKKKKDSRPTPAQVFNGLSTVFDFTGAAFGSIRVSDSEDCSDVQEESFKLALGDLIYKDLCKLLIKECLAQAVPTARRDLKSFEKVVKLTEDFQERLIKLGFVRAGRAALLDYARNVDNIFADKCCRDLAARARCIMQKELYDSTPAPGSDAEKTVTETTNLLTDLKLDFSESSKVSESVSSPNTFGGLFVFPTCLISKCTVEFVELLYEVMEEACCSSPLCSGRLIETVRNMVGQYCAVVPCYHRDHLDAFPQQSALFHNNCMFISHHLLTLGHQFQGRLPFPGSDSLVTFVDLVPMLRDIGTRVFLSQMQSQKKQLLTLVSEVGGFHKLYVSDSFFGELKRTIRKCMLQLGHLKKVWQGVLPNNVYSKAIGTLMNSLVEELICQTVQLEDLPAESAGQFIEIFNIVKETGPVLFQEPDSDETNAEVYRRILKWSKFLELLFLLDANLQTILDRWACGKGPLPQEFSADELKKIIRALFQNTDHRASVLAKIK